MPKSPPPCSVCRAAPAVARCVCPRCYKGLHQAVQGGLVTWAELEQRGMVRPARRRGRPPGAGDPGPQSQGRGVPTEWPPCLTCRERFAVLHGCCPRCYARHLGAVVRGRTTWAALQARGRVAKPRRGRPPDVERRRFAAALRAQGLTFAEIGRRLGLTHQGARHLVAAHQREKHRGK